MLDDSNHRRRPGYVHRERVADPNGMWDPSFFAVRLVTQNEYIVDDNAIGVQR